MHTVPDPGAGVNTLGTAAAPSRMMGPVALLTTAEAAERCDVMPHRVRDWARRGLLIPADRTGLGWPLYRAEDADGIERRTSRVKRGLDGRWTTVAH